MPNLIPQSVLGRIWLGWAHPAGRLIWATLILVIGLSFLFALIRPPLEHKIISPKQAVAGGVLLVILCLLLARFVSALEVLAVWTAIVGLTGIALAAVMSRDPRPPDRQATWAESMAGAFGAFVLFVLGYAVIPSEWITFSDKYLRWTPDKILLKTYPIKPNYQQMRDVIVVVIYVAFLGLNMQLWSKWQKRLVAKPEAAPAGEGAPVRTSRFGRPVRTKA